MLDVLTNTLAFVFAIGVIIFVHEAGHFLVAKGFGMRVLAFSLGFGKRIWGFRRGETEYRVAVLPLGGYVKLSGEEPEDSTDDPREFLNRPRWQRIAVYLAGPAMNVVLSIVLIWALFMVGIDVPALQSIPAVVGEIEPGSPAESAGFLPGDRIVEVDGRDVDRWQDVAFIVMTSVGRPVAFAVERAGERRNLTATPARPDGLGDRLSTDRVLFSSLFSSRPPTGMGGGADPDSTADCPLRKPCRRSPSRARGDFE